jgi:two-component system nitrate/nitrite response regulator NarL
MPDVKVVLVAESNESVDVQRVLALSPDACIFSLSSRDTLIKVLELILMNQRVFVFAKPAVTTVKLDVEFADSPQHAQSRGSHECGNGHSLSPRESQVLTSLVQGRSNKLIARVCQISEATVKVHLKAILRKIQAQNRTQAAIWAIEHGFRDPSLESNGLSVGNGRAEPPAVSSVAQPTAPRDALVWVNQIAVFVRCRPQEANSVELDAL